MRCTRQFLVPIALVAMGALTLCFSGCKKEEAKPADPSSPAVYMKDKVFRGKLSADRKERQALMASRAEIVSQMKAMIDAKKREMKTTDLAKVKAELDKSPEWQSLYRQCTNANAKVDAHRQKTLKTVRERISPKKPISK